MVKKVLRQTGLQLKQVSVQYACAYEYRFILVYVLVSIVLFVCKSYLWLLLSA